MFDVLLSQCHGFNEDLSLFGSIFGNTLSFCQNVMVLMNVFLLGSIYSGYLSQCHGFNECLSFLLVNIIIQVYAVISGYSPELYMSSVSVSYTCGFYGIPVIGISARECIFSDKVSPY